MGPVYARLSTLLGPDGAQYAYFDDAYLASDPVSMSLALVATPTICKKVGLRIGGGPGKTELMLPLDCDPYAFLLLLDTFVGGLPHIVTGFNACLGVPRHAFNDPEFIVVALEGLGTRLGRLLDLVEDLAEEDFFAALWLLQVCVVQRFGHGICDVPPMLVTAFAHARDEAVTSIFAAI